MLLARLDCCAIADVRLLLSMDRAVTMPPKKALSVRQPWAHAILRGGKNIENRSWPTELRGTIALHAARSMDAAAVDAFFQFLEARHLAGPWATHDIVDALPRGAIVGLGPVFS